MMMHIDLYYTTTLSDGEETYLNANCFSPLMYGGEGLPDNALTIRYVPRIHITLNQDIMQMYIDAFSLIFPEWEGKTPSEIHRDGLVYDLSSTSAAYIIQSFKFLRAFAEHAYAFHHAANLPYTLGVIRKGGLDAVAAWMLGLYTVGKMLRSNSCVGNYNDWPGHSVVENVRRDFLIKALKLKHLRSEKTVVGSERAENSSAYFFGGDADAVPTVVDVYSYLDKGDPRTRLREIFIYPEDAL